MTSRDRFLREWLAARNRRQPQPAKTPQPRPTAPHTPTPPPTTGGGSTTPTTPPTTGKWGHQVQLTFPTPRAKGQVFTAGSPYASLVRYSSGSSTGGRGVWATDEIASVENGYLVLDLLGTKGGAVLPFGGTGAVAYKWQMVFKNEIVTPPRDGFAGHHHVPLTYPDASAGFPGGDWSRGEGDLAETDYIAGKKATVYLHATDGDPSRNADIHPWAADIFDKQEHTLTVEYDPATGWDITLDSETHHYDGADAHPVFPFHPVDQQEAAQGSLPIDPLAESKHYVKSYTGWTLA